MFLEVDFSHSHWLLLCVCVCVRWGIDERLVRVLWSWIMHQGVCVGASLVCVGARLVCVCTCLSSLAAPLLKPDLWRVLYLWVYKSEGGCFTLFISIFPFSLVFIRSAPSTIYWSGWWDSIWWDMSCPGCCWLSFIGLILFAFLDFLLFLLVSVGAVGQRVYIRAHKLVLVSVLNFCSVGF
jgi:hypothetical protein